MIYIFRRLIFCAFLGSSFLANAQAPEAQIGHADSLFSIQKYTEAFTHYESTLQSGWESPSMLVKMAFIQEGLGNEAEALYYLNRYYKHTFDRNALQKMREIAEANNLSGYAYSDLSFFLDFLRQYQLPLAGGLAAFSLFLVAYGYRKKIRGETPAISLVLQLLTVGALAILINGWAYADRALVKSEHTLLMAGPSAGAEPLYFIEKGHRVKVKKQDAIWSCIEWEGTPVYVRTKNLLFL